MSSRSPSTTTLTSLITASGGSTTSISSTYDAETPQRPSKTVSRKRDNSTATTDVGSNRSFYDSDPDDLSSLAGRRATTSPPSCLASILPVAEMVDKNNIFVFVDLSTLALEGGKRATLASEAPFCNPHLDSRWTFDFVNLLAEVRVFERSMRNLPADHPVQLAFMAVAASDARFSEALLRESSPEISRVLHFDHLARNHVDATLTLYIATLVEFMRSNCPDVSGTIVLFSGDSVPCASTHVIDESRGLRMTVWSFSSDLAMSLKYAGHGAKVKFVADDCLSKFMYRNYAASDASGAKPKLQRCVRLELFWPVDPTLTEQGKSKSIVDKLQLEAFRPPLRPVFFWDQASSTSNSVCVLVECTGLESVDDTILARLRTHIEPFRAHYPVLVTRPHLVPSLNLKLQGAFSPSGPRSGHDNHLNEADTRPNSVRTHHSSDSASDSLEEFYGNSTGDQIATFVAGCAPSNFRFVEDAVRNSGNLTDDDSILQQLWSALPARSPLSTTALAPSPRWQLPVAVTTPVAGPPVSPAANPQLAIPATPIVSSATSLAAPVPRPVAAPVTAPVAPAAASVATPTAAPVATPAAAPVAAPVAVPVRAPVAAPVVASVRAPVAAPVVAPVATPSPAAWSQPRNREWSAAPVAVPDQARMSAPAQSQARIQPHTGQQPQSKPQSKTRCPNRALCDAGLECEHMHTQAEQDMFVVRKGFKKHPSYKAHNFKTEPCKNLNNKGGCQYKDRCLFAHGDATANCKSCREVGHLSTNCPRLVQLNRM